MCEPYKGQMSMCSGLIFKNARPATINMTVTYNTEWATQTFVTSLTDIPIISMTYTYCNHTIQWNEGYVRVEGSKFRLTEPVMAGGAVVDPKLSRLLNTTAVQRLLGVESATLETVEHRGVYRLLSYDPNFLASSFSKQYYCNPNDFYQN